MFNRKIEVQTHILRKKFIAKNNKKIRKQKKMTLEFCENNCSKYVFVFELFGNQPSSIIIIRSFTWKLLSKMDTYH